MPELPEVEALRRALEKDCLGKRIEAVVAKETGGGPRQGQFDDLIFEGHKEAEVVEALQGRKIVCMCRRGKHMWAQLDDPPVNKGMVGRAGRRGAVATATRAAFRFVLLHMGMTGSLVFKHRAVPQYKAFSVSTDWPPRFCKLELVFEGGVHLAFTDPRRWGKIRLRAEDPLLESPLSDLAPDALLDLPPLAHFADKLRASAAPVKALLLDQERVVSGVGNWVADEILYQARVDPAKAGKKLSDEEVCALHKWTFEVCDVACKANAEGLAFPTSWLFHHRWANKAKGIKMDDGRAVIFETIGGRTTAIVPSLQRKAQETNVATEAVDKDEQVAAEKGAKKRSKADTQGQASPSASRTAATATSGSTKKRGGRRAEVKLEEAETIRAVPIGKQEDDTAKGMKRQSGRAAEPKEDAEGAGKRPKTRGGTGKEHTGLGEETHPTKRAGGQRPRRGSKGAEGKELGPET